MNATDKDIKNLFDAFRKSIAHVNKIEDLDDELITSLWTVSILTTMQKINKDLPQGIKSGDDEHLLPTARLVALKHFDLMLLDSYGIEPEGDLACVHSNTKSPNNKINGIEYIRCLEFMELPKPIEITKLIEFRINAIR
jgi:hypothetical protein